MSGVILPYKNILPTIDTTAFIAPTAVVIGDAVVGPDTGLWFGVVVRGDVNEIRIGARVNIQDGSVIHVTSGGCGTYIGDDVTVGHMAVLHACTLETGSFVGMKACVMDGAVVESQAMVAAGALVTPNKRIKSGQLWAGSPARHIRDLTPEEIAFFPKSAKHYVELARQYRQQLAASQG
ncbi:Protein YrdA [Azospirillaceae bacterium]